MNVDEIDTVLLLRTRSPTDSGRKPILQQNYIQIGRDKQGKEILKFAKSLHRFYLYKELIFTKEIDCHFEDRCENKLG